MSALTIATVGLFLAVVVGMLALTQALAGRRSAARLNERIRTINAIGEKLEPNVRGELIRQVEEKQIVGGLDVARYNPVRIHQQSGVKQPFWQVLAGSASVAVVISAASMYLISTPLVQVPLAIGLTFVLLLFFLRRARRKRCDRFCEQLPDALDVAVRSLKAGHPFVVSLGLVAEEMPDPVGSEFALLSEQLSYGARMEDCLEAMQKRVPAEDLRYLAMALVIHDRTGGNLAHTLRTLGEVIRARYHLRGKVRALSAEGRFTAKLMSVFPLILYCGLNLVAPTYYDDFWNSELSTYIIVFSVVTTIIGNIVINKMVEIKV